MIHILLRSYLLAGLVAHKAVWEVLKRRDGGAGRAHDDRDRRAVVAQTAKLLILIGIVAQTLIPEAWLGPLVIGGAAEPRRIIGVILYTLGLVVAVTGRVQLGRNWLDIEKAAVLQSQELVRAGLYRYIRHPIYAGDLVLLVGLELALNSWLVVGAVLLVPIVARQAVREEMMLMDRLPGYREYCETSKRFIPFLF